MITQDAYDLACKALWKHRDALEQLYTSLQDITHLGFKEPGQFLAHNRALQQARDALVNIPQEPK